MLWVSLGLNVLHATLLSRFAPARMASETANITQCKGLAPENISGGAMIHKAV